MFFIKKPNIDLFPLLVFLLRVTIALSDGPTIYELFPQASKFYEEKFCSRREPSVWNLWSSPKQNICNRDIHERIEICKGILQHVFKPYSALILATKETSITAEESECVDLPVAFHWLSVSGKDESMVHCYRCPLKYSLDSSSVYAVGGLDPKYASFYIVQGEFPKSVYVLHDIIKADENKDAYESSTLQRSKTDVTNGADTASHQGAEITEAEPSLVEPLAQLSDEIINASQEPAEITKVEPALAAEFADSAFHEILADPDRKLYVSRSFRVEKVKVKNAVNYKIIEVPDFSQMTRVSA